MSDSVAHKPCGQLRIKGSQSNSSQQVKAEVLSYVLHFKWATQNIISWKRERGNAKTTGGVQYCFPLCPWKKITEIHLNQTPQPPQRCLQLIWSVGAVPFCVTHFFSPCGNGCTFTGVALLGIRTLSYSWKLDVTNTWFTFGGSHLSTRSEDFFRESCR